MGGLLPSATAVQPTRASPALSQNHYCCAVAWVRSTISMPLPTVQRDGVRPGTTGAFRVNLGAGCPPPPLCLVLTCSGHPQLSKPSTCCCCRCIDNEPKTKKTHSAETAPRRPVLKLSMVRTVLASSGTAVPPAVIHTTGRPDKRFSARNASRASPVCASLAWEGVSAQEKHEGTPRKFGEAGVNKQPRGGGCRGRGGMPPPSAPRRVFR